MSSWLELGMVLGRFWVKRVGDSVVLLIFYFSLLILLFFFLVFKGYGFVWIFIVV